MIKVIIAVMILTLQAYPQFDKFDFLKRNAGTAVSEEAPTPPIFSPSDFDSLITWLTPATIWTGGAWGDTSGIAATISPDPWLVQSSNLTIGTTSKLKDQPRFLHTNNGTSGWLSSLSSTVVWYGEFNNWTVFYVDSGKTGATAYMSLSGQYGDGYNELVFHRTDNAEHFNLLIRDANGSIISFAGDSVVTGKWGIHCFQFSGDTRTARLITSGDTTSTTIGAFIANTTHPGYEYATLFRGNYSSNVLWNGGIAEVIAYRGYKTLAEINQIAQYLSGKFGLTWNTNFL